MRRLNRYVPACLLLGLWLFPAAGHAAGRPCAETTVTQESAADRSFSVTAGVWSDEERLQEVPACGIVVLLEVSDSMLNLAGVSDNSTAYQPDVPYRSMAENAALYTLEGGEYKPVILQDSQYVLAVHSDFSTLAATDKAVGEQQDGQALFTRTVYEQGDSPTKLAEMKRALQSGITELADFSPDSQVAVIYYGSSAGTGETHTLDEQGAEALRQEIEGCEQYFSTGDKNADAWEQAAEKLQSMREGGMENLKVLCLTDGIGRDQTEEEAGRAKSAVQAMKVDGVSLYTVGWFPENGQEEQDFTAAFSSAPAEKFIRTVAGENPESGVLAACESILDCTPVQVKLALDPRFTVAAEERQALLQQGAELREENGTQTVVWEASLPRRPENPWQGSVTVCAREAFPGGNDVTLLAPESGVYWYGEQQETITAQTVNVPLKSIGTAAQTEIFLGQSVPGDLQGSSVLSGFFGGTEPDWFQKGATGSLFYCWEYEAGGRIGTDEQLKKIRPDADQVFRLVQSYRPGSDGAGSVGKPCVAGESEALYRVRVITGQVTVRVRLTEKEAKALGHGAHLFKLQGQELTRYQTMSLQDRNEDGEGIILEIRFGGLPFGRYSLTEETGDPQSPQETVCTLGFAKDSDKISTENAEVIVYPDIQNTNPETNRTISERKFQLAREE